MTAISVRRLDIDRAKGLGIVLVVFGHLAAKSRPLGNDWFGYAQTAVYQFHMPFFMYLSGYVGMLVGAFAIRGAQWPALVVSRARRLLVPFVGFGLLLTFGKMLAVGVIHVDHPPESVATALLGLFWYTDHSPAISVWYIGVLFVFSVITPVLFWLAGSRLWPLALLGLVVIWLPVPPVFFADKMAAFYIFFILGAICASFGDRWTDMVDRVSFAILPLFVATVFLAVTYFDEIPQPVRLLACGVLSIPALHGLVRQSWLAGSKSLLHLGVFSFVIYLLNTPFIGLTKGLMLKAMPWDGRNFLIYLPLLMFAGLYGPILLKKSVFRHVPSLDRLTN